MTDQSKELLRRIDEALRGAILELPPAQLNDRYDNTSMQCIKAREALVSLRSMLEGDGGEEATIRSNIQQLIAGMAVTPLGAQIVDETMEALFRLSAKAKIGETQIREAKREVLEEVFSAVGTSSKTDTFRKWLSTWLLEQLAALKEADRG